MPRSPARSPEKWAKIIREADSIGESPSQTARRVGCKVGSVHSARSRLQALEARQSVEDAAPRVDDPGLDPRRYRAAQMLVDGYTVAQVARTVHAAHETVKGWRDSDSAFGLTMAELRSERHRATLEAIAAGAARAVAVNRKATDLVERLIDRANAAIERADEVRAQTEAAATSGDPDQWSAAQELRRVATDEASTAIRLAVSAAKVLGTTGNRLLDNVHPTTLVLQGVATEPEPLAEVSDAELAELERLAEHRLQVVRG